MDVLEGIEVASYPPLRDAMCDMIDGCALIKRPAVYAHHARTSARRRVQLVRRVGPCAHYEAHDEFHFHTRAA